LKWIPRFSGAARPVHHRPRFPLAGGLGFSSFLFHGCVMKQAIKRAALILLDDSLVMRRGELYAQLEHHMTAQERGKCFYQVRDTVAELVADGFINVQVIKVGGRQCTLFVFDHGFSDRG
jgi:hypothetical protein